MRSIAAQARENKERQPSLYCSEPRCLFRIQTRFGVTPCPKHPVAAVHIANEQSKEVSA